ncbi:MAG: hypothetical protein AAB378_00495 [Patescibacteria group bacterium]
MDMDQMRRRAQVLAMQNDLEKSQNEYKQMLREFQGACHHESVVEIDDNVVGKRRICVICGVEEGYWVEDRGGYIKLSFPLVVQRLSVDDFYRYRKLHRLVLAPVPAPEPKATK